MEKVYAVLIDIISIQKYVFGSNKLKENIGASFLVKDIYESILHQAVKEVFKGQNFYFDRWKKEVDKIAIENEVFEIGYIGGGNALLFFKEPDKTKEPDKAREFIRLWTKILLIEAPGLVTGIACEEFDIKNFKENNKALFNKLKENKYKYIPQTILPRHGITAECKRSGYSIEKIWNYPEDKEGEYLSSMTNAKIDASKETKNVLEKRFKDILNDKFTFTDNLEELGQKYGQDSHIAIVHIDGNEIGKRFQDTEELRDIRALARDLEKATENSFENLLKKIINNFELIEEEVTIYKANNKKILPIRPIILGGDDITFVSDGKLGIYFAKLFMEAFEMEAFEKEPVSDGKPLTSCAGIAITKTKFPFYRGYELAEQLCNKAKIVRKEKKKNGSWIDFHIAYSGFSGTLEEIRNDHYKAIQGDLLFRPYMINSKEEYGFDTLIRKTKELNKLPKSKIAELRTVLTQGVEATSSFVIREKTLPEYGTYKNKLFENSKTPYFDMIEIIGCYPDFELRKEAYDEDSQN
jgi:hypothetical protein